MLRALAVDGGMVKVVEGDALTRESDEQEIVLHVRSGVADGLERLIARYGAEIHAVAYSICHDQQMAEDATAETFATAWRRIGSLRDPTRIRAWLLRIATRQALDQLRRARKVYPAIHQERTDANPGIEAAAVDRIDVAQALARLPPQMRAAMTLRYVADLTVDEISAATGKSRNTIKSELRVGLRRLRETWHGTSG